MRGGTYGDGTRRPSGAWAEREPERARRLPERWCRHDHAGAGVTTPPRYRIGEVGRAGRRVHPHAALLRGVRAAHAVRPQPRWHRRYTDADVERLRHIRELRNVMGFDLDRIGLILDAEDRLAQLRQAVATGVTRSGAPRSSPRPSPSTPTCGPR